MWRRSRWNGNPVKWYRNANVKNKQTNKQTSKRESWSHHVWTVSLWPFWQFDVIKKVPFSVLNSVECTRNFVFAWYMFKDRLCFNNLDKSFDISNWFIPFKPASNRTGGNYNLWRRYVVIDFISDFSSFRVVWLIEKKKKKLVAIETINNKITGTFTAPRMLHCEVQL